MNPERDPKEQAQCGPMPDGEAAGGQASPEGTGSEANEAPTSTRDDTGPSCLLCGSPLNGNRVCPTCRFPSCPGCGEA